MAITTINDIRYCDVHLMKQKLEIMPHITHAEILALLCNLIDTVGQLENKVKDLEAAMKK